MLKDRVEVSEANYTQRYSVLLTWETKENRVRLSLAMYVATR